MQVTETPKMYAAVVKPYIDSIQASRIQWVYNILDKKVSFRYQLLCAFQRYTQSLQPVRGKIA